MSDGDAPSLGKLRLPPAGGDFAFTYSGRRFHLHGNDGGWALHHGEKDHPAMARLTRRDEGWAVIPPDEDREWYDAIHFLAVAAFLNDLEHDTS